MTTRIIKTEYERQQAIKLLTSYQLPATLTLTKGANRSTEQNKLQRLWLNEAAEQGDQTAEEYRAYCKLHYGVPLLRNENHEFRESYDRIIRPHTYEDKLEMMSIPLDFPVTRLMTTKQLTTYLDQVHAHFAGLGFILTQP